MIFFKELKNNDLTPFYKKKVLFLNQLQACRISKPFEHDIYSDLPLYRKSIKTLGWIPPLKKALDNGGSCNALLIKLFKKYDYIVHVLKAELFAYGFDNISLSLIYSLFNDGKQRTKKDLVFIRLQKGHTGISYIASSLRTITSQLKLKNPVFYLESM